jgi:hypothetical protein
MATSGLTDTGAEWIEFTPCTDDAMGLKTSPQLQRVRFWGCSRDLPTPTVEVRDGQKWFVYDFSSDAATSL